MKYDIYYHNDFDGRASAAVMLAFLRSRGDEIEGYFPLTYGAHEHLFDRNAFAGKNPAIIVDFMYHPGAAWWFDHHPTAFKKPEWKKHFRPDKQHRLDPKYPSCTHLVYASLVKDFKWRAPAHFKSFVKWADILDGAGYASARQTIEMKDPGVIINSYIEGMPHATREDKHMIDLMARKPLSTVIRDPSIARDIARLKKKVRSSIAFYEKHMRVFKRSTFIDLTKDPLNGLLRYAPYYLCPKSVYSFRMRPKGKWWYLGVSANPWRARENRFDIGKIMKKYNGGGHKGVGATEFHTRADAVRAFEKINKLFDY